MDEYPVTFTTKFQSKSPVAVMEGFIKSVQPTKQDLEEVGGWLVKRIKERTLSGIDIYGDPFAPYSPRYATEKGSYNVTLYSARKTSNPRQMSLFDMGPEHMLDTLSSRISADAGGLVLEVGILDNAFTAKRGRLMQEGWQPVGHVGRRYTKGKMRGKFRKRPQRVPPRPWLGATPEDRTEMRNILADSVTARAVRFLNA